MEAAKLNLWDTEPFMPLIAGDVADEIRKYNEMPPLDFMTRVDWVVYGAYDEDTKAPCGVLCAQCAGYTVVIRSLFVDPLRRSEGAARILLDALLCDAAQDDIATIEMLASMDSPEQMEVAQYLGARGYISEEAEERYYRTSISEIKESGLFKNAKTDGIVPLSEIMATDLRILGNSLAGREYTYIPVPIEKDAYDNDISMFFMVEGSIKDFILVKEGDNELIIAYALSSGNGAGIVSVFSAALQSASEKYKDDMAVVIPTVNENSQKTVEKIVPGAEAVKFVRMSYPIIRIWSMREEAVK